MRLLSLTLSETGECAGFVWVGGWVGWGKIWTLSDRGAKKYLVRDDFLIAMRLIALAQHGAPISMHSLTTNTGE